MFAAAGSEAASRVVPAALVRPYAGHVSNPEQNARVKGFPPSQYLPAATSKAASGSSGLSVSSSQSIKSVSDSLIVSTFPRGSVTFCASPKGVKIGRPKLGLELRQRIAQRAAKGETPYAIAKALGIDRHKAAKYAS